MRIFRDDSCFFSLRLNNTSACQRTNHFIHNYLSLCLLSMKHEMGGEKFIGGSIAGSLPSPRAGLKTVMKKMSKSYGKVGKGLYKPRAGIAVSHKPPGVLFSDTGSVYSIVTIVTKSDQKTSATHGLRKKGHGWTVSTPTVPKEAIKYGHANLEDDFSHRSVRFRSWDSVLSNDYSSWSDDDSDVSRDTFTSGFFCGLTEDDYDDNIFTEDDLDEIFANSPFAKAFLCA